MVVEALLSYLHYPGGQARYLVVIRRGCPAAHPSLSYASRFTTILDSGLDELGSLISPFKDMLGYNYKNEEGGAKWEEKGAR
jgi:hypothetical protein